MIHVLADFFNSDDFMPHGHCFLWQPAILWLHVISDAGIVAAYFAIPFALLYFIWKRKDLPFQKVFMLFGAFILLCGATHFMAIWVIWHPDYALEGVIKALTAMASIATFLVTVTLIPQALRLPSPAQLALINGQLQDANAKLEILYKQRSESTQAHLRAVVDHAVDGLITINAHGIIESFNPACEYIFGYKTSEVAGQNIKMLMPEPYHNQHDGYLRHYNTTGEAKIIGTSGREVSGKRKDGSVFPIDLSISAFKLADGQHFSGIIRDITQRKKSDEQLQRYTRELERSNQELDDFAYIASHDLKEPLRGLFNHASFLLEDYKDKLSEDGVFRLNRMTSLAQRMERLVNDLLYFSRLGRAQMAMQETDLDAVIDDIQQMMESLLKERRASIVVPKPMPHIVCDSTRITEVFRNLITNAVKYNDKPEPKIEVGFHTTLETPQGIERDVFYVKDNGIGIAPEFHEEIFRIFKRLQSPIDDKNPGTGVGLTFVKKIIERCHGRIWLESALGQGSVFYFTIGRNPA